MAAWRVIRGRARENRLGPKTDAANLRQQPDHAGAAPRGAGRAQAAAGAAWPIAAAARANQETRPAMSIAFQTVVERACAGPCGCAPLTCYSWPMDCPTDSLKPWL